MTNFVEDFEDNKQHSLQSALSPSLTGNEVGALVDTRTEAPRTKVLRRVSAPTVNGTSVSETQLSKEAVNLQENFQDTGGLRSAPSRRSARIRKQTEHPGMVDSAWAIRRNSGSSQASNAEPAARSKSSTKRLAQNESSRSTKKRKKSPGSPAANARVNEKSLFEKATDPEGSGASSKHRIRTKNARKTACSESEVGNQISTPTAAGPEDLTAQPSKQEEAARHAVSSQVAAEADIQHTARVTSEEVVERSATKHVSPEIPVVSGVPPASDCDTSVQPTVVVPQCSEDSAQTGNVVQDTVQVDERWRSSRRTRRAPKPETTEVKSKAAERRPRRQRSKTRKDPSIPNDRVVQDSSMRNETSHEPKLRTHKNPPASSETPLEPFDEVPPDPVIPPGTKGEWSFDPETRVLLADFRNVEVISADLKLVLLEFMERDDISLVSWGLIDSIDVASGNILDYLLMAFHGGTPYHKFRRFDRVQKEDVTYFEENETFITMLVSDFCKYMKLRLEGSKEPFDFVNSETRQAIHFDNVEDVSLYMIDVEMPKFTPYLCKRYMKNFKAEEILPGGEFCMMNAVSPSARPFMGPNLYLTCGGFTSFHQDGHGTVDSGHTCLSGYNEVVMLRRLPEEHKLNAMRFLPRGESAMYRLPHETRKTDLQIWPRNSTIHEWKAMNYAPSVFILGPGQHLHINKGRLHCFRKLTPDPLASTDCHNILRNELLSELRSKSLMSASTFMCLSIAYDWMFLGVSAEGIQREVESCLECSERCRTRPIPLKYLAIPETCVTKMATQMLPTGDSFFRDLLWDSNTVLPKGANVRRGILPSLRRLVEREETLPILSPPDAHESAERSPIDPYGSDFMCHICHGELSNVYFHCMGCENLLSKDLNICTHCHQSGKFHMKIVMHPVDKRSLTDVNHIGSEDRKDRRGHCSCKQGTCKTCGYCRLCSCRCHHEFQQRRRFFTKDQLTEVLDCVEGLSSGEALR